MNKVWENHPEETYEPTIQKKNKKNENNQTIAVIVSLFLPSKPPFQGAY